MPFPSTVLSDFAPGIPGDFASANPYASVLAGPGALVAGTNGLQAGLFAWVTTAGPDNLVTTASNTGTGAPDGFVHREFNALMTTFLAETGNIIPAGREVTLHEAGDFWAKTTTTATRKQKVFAVLATGAIATGAAGATISGAVETRWYVHSAGAVGEVIKISHRAVG